MLENFNTFRYNISLKNDLERFSPPASRSISLKVVIGVLDVVVVVVVVVVSVKKESKYKLASTCIDGAY